MHNGQNLLDLSQEGRPTSVHGGSNYWRMMRAAATALKWKSGALLESAPWPPREQYLTMNARIPLGWALVSRLAFTGSVHGKNTYLRAIPRCEEERMEQRKAARLALDTSTRGTVEYRNFLQQCLSPVSTQPLLR